ncbi:MAG TPA: VOC family protein [Chthoniobacterales bacterium]
MSTITGFHHIALRAADYEGACSFYSDILGFKKKISWGEGDRRGVMLDTGDGNYVEIFAGGSPAPQPDGAILHVAFRTDDTAALLERVRAAGYEVTEETRVVDIPSAEIGVVPVKIAFFKGPTGEIIELFENQLT